jgi:hypothetical protein
MAVGLPGTRASKDVGGYYLFGYEFDHATHGQRSPMWDMTKLELSCARPAMDALRNYPTPEKNIQA